MSTDTVKIGIDQLRGDEEIYTDLFTCPRCQYGYVNYDHRFCPHCGVAFAWEEFPEPEDSQEIKLAKLLERIKPQRPVRIGLYGGAGIDWLDGKRALNYDAVVGGLFACHLLEVRPKTGVMHRWINLPDCHEWEGKLFNPATFFITYIISKGEPTWIEIEFPDQLMPYLAPGCGRFEEFFAGARLTLTAINVQEGMARCWEDIAVIPAGDGIIKGTLPASYMGWKFYRPRGEE